MQLRMPDNAGTVDALIEESRRSPSIVVLYFTDPTGEASPAWQTPQWGTQEQSSAQDDLVRSVADRYGDSPNFGGRPLVVLRIDRDMPGMDAICAMRGVYTVPLLQIYSRGTAEALDPAQLETRLISLGARSRATSTDERVGAFGPRSRSTAQSDEADFFGIAPTDAQPRLTREGAERSSMSEPRRAASLPTGVQPDGADDDGEVPVEALNMESARDEQPATGSIEAKLDALFDDEDFERPPI